MVFHRIWWFSDHASNNDPKQLDARDTESKSLRHFHKNNRFEELLKSKNRHKVKTSKENMYGFFLALSICPFVHSLPDSLVYSVRASIENWGNCIAAILCSLQIFGSLFEWIFIVFFSTVFPCPFFVYVYYNIRIIVVVVVIVCMCFHYANPYDLP